jgi:hypothetical protein
MVQVGAGAVILDAGRDLRLDKTSTRPWDRIATFSRSDRVTAPQSAEENTPVNSESDTNALNNPTTVCLLRFRRSMGIEEEAENIK